MEKKVLAEFTIEGLDKLTADTAKLIREQNELRASSKLLDKTTEEGSKEFVKQSNQIKSLGKEISVNNKLIQAATGVSKNLTNEINREITSINQARASNTELLKIRNDLNLNTKEGVAAADQINKKLDENNAFIKENVSQYEKQKISIGDYGTAIKEAFRETGGFNSALLGLQQTLSVFAPLGNAIKNDLSNIASQFKASQAEATGLNVAQKVLNTTNNALSASFKVLRLAIASTGIGALLIALGSLITFLTSTQRGMDALTSVTRPLQAVMQALLGVVQDLGGRLFDLGKTAVTALSSPKQVLQDLVDFIRTRVENRINGLAKAFDALRSGDFTGVAKGLADAATGVENVTDKVRNGFNSVRDSVSETTTRLKEAAAIGTQIDQLKKAEVRAERDLILLRAEQLRVVKEQNKIAEDTTKSNQEREQAAENAIAATERILAAEQNLLDKRISTKRLENSLNDTSIEDQKELNQLIAERTDKETQALELQTTLQNKLNTIRDQSESQRISRVQEAIDNANNELEIFILNNQSKLDAEKRLTDDLVAEEVRRLGLIKDERLRILQEQRDNELVSDSEFRLQKAQLEDEFNTQRSEINKEKAEQDKAEEDLNKIEQFNQEIERLQEEDATRFEIQRAQVERDRAQALIDAENEIIDKAELERRKNEIEEQAKDSSEKIKKEETKVRVAAAENAFGQIAQLLGEETAAGKAAAIAQATISTYQGVARVWEAPSILPEPFGTTAKVISTATVLASGLQSVKKITSTPVPKAEKGLEVSSGGLLQGKRHSQGGILIEAEGGEMIMNRTATSMFLPQLRQMQAIGNGNTGLLRQPFANDGGIVSRSIERSNRTVAISNLQDIRVINVASDTVDVASEESIVVQNANI